MAAPPVDLNSVLDESGLTVVETEFTRELRCPSCDQWVRTHFMGKRVYMMAETSVMLVICHKPKCPVFEAFLKAMKDS